MQLWHCRSADRPLRLRFGHWHHSAPGAGVRAGFCQVCDRQCDNVIAVTIDQITTNIISVIIDIIVIISIMDGGASEIRDACNADVCE